MLSLLYRVELIRKHLVERELVSLDGMSVARGSGRGFKQKEFMKRNQILGKEAICLT